jgi:hypothetical protein
MTERKTPHMKSFLLSLTILLLTVVPVLAQPGGGGDPGGGQPVPISGLEVLLVGGALLGIRSLKSMRREDKLK